jgi:hypothetical protein
MFNTFAQQSGIRPLHTSMVCALLLVGAAMNGFAARIIEHWQTGAPASLFLGISPFEVIAVAVGALLVMRAPAALILRPGIAEVLAAGTLLIPSSAAAWGALAAYAVYVAWNARDDLRRGALVFLLLAAAALWSSVVLKALALPITALEASVVGALLALFKTTAVVTGNVVGIPHEHSLILMTACSSADGLPKALVGLAALLVLSGGFAPRRFIAYAIVVSVFYVMANLVRLTAMAWSADLYTLAHGPIGANVFDGVTALAVIGVGLFGQDE